MRWPLQAAVRMMFFGLVMRRVVTMGGFNLHWQCDALFDHVRVS
jgi:hypothetical protein